MEPSKVASTASSDCGVVPSSYFSGLRTEEYGTFIGQQKSDFNAADLRLIRPAYDLKVPCAEVSTSLLGADKSTSFEQMLVTDAWEDIPLVEEPTARSWDNIPYGKPAPTGSNCCIAAAGALFLWVEKILVDGYDKYVGHSDKKTTQFSGGQR